MRNTQIKKVSIVVFAYNNLKYTSQALNSLLKNTQNDYFFSYSFSLYDDSSTDKTEEFIKTNYKNLFYYKEVPNKGFNNLCNKAYEMNENFDYLIILNNDVKFSKDWAKNLLSNMIKEKAQVAGPITNAPGHQPMQDVRNFLNSYYPSDEELEINKISMNLKDKKNFNAKYLNGFCMGFDIKWLNSLNKPIFSYDNPNFGLEEIFFNKYPENKPLVVPSSFVFHYKQVTVKNNPKDKKIKLRNQHYRLIEENNNHNIAVGIITCDRNELLKNCIDSLIVQNFSKSYDLIIVDNDTNQTAKNIIKQYSESKKINIIYDSESTRGIPYARNKLVDIAINKNYDYLVFIDDDEIADKDWLNNLYSSINKFNADIVSGPVYPLFNEPISKWIIYGNFLRTKKRNHNTGDVLKVCYTNNIMISTKIFKKYPIPFNIKFKYSGGSDSHFFRKIYNDGYKIVWCEEAEVHEIISGDRLTLKWNLFRIFRVGNCYAISLKINKNYKRIIKEFLESLMKILIAMIVLPIAFLFFIFGNEKYFIRRIRRLFKSIGFICGIIGYQYQEYK